MIACGSNIQKQNLQIEFKRPLPGGSDFVSYVDAIGEVDGSRCIIDWKTTTSRYPDEPEGLLSLDPQLAYRYSWMTGLSDVALVVFVRKQAPEIQYLKTSISDEKRREFGEVAFHAIREIEAGNFQATQRDPVSTEWMRELFSFGALSRESTTC